MPTDYATYRKIIHIDMDAFFAAVEQRDRPEWKGKPLVVGGNSSRSVVAAASYEAREFGIHSAMPMVVALNRCPNIIIAPHRFEVYKAVNQQIRAIFLQYTDKVEFLSLDEAYLDVTENTKGLPSGTLLAEQIRADIYREVSLTASAGISFNKFLAKIASDLNKPNGQYAITPEEAPAFIDTLPVHKFYGIGKVTAQKMQKLGIRKGADLKKWSKPDLIQRFGKIGGHYYNIVHLIDEREVKSERVRKSWSVERTFSKNLLSEEALFEKIEELTDHLFERSNNNIPPAKTLTIKLKTADFQQVTKSASPGILFTNKQEVLRYGIQLSKTFFQVNQQAEIRLAGIGLSNFEERQSGSQLHFE